VASRKALIPTEEITRAIFVMRGHRVLLDTELAALYGVTTKRLNEQVKRNAKRFPEDFMFQVTAQEAAGLRSQIATSKTVGRGGRRHRPYVFTKHGAWINSKPESRRSSPPTTMPSPPCYRPSDNS
jgi:hypothetical protein